MKYYHYILLLCSVVFSTTINIPGDYPTIQEGIDVATTGDTVLVADGDYQENIVISKSILLTSHAIFDDLDDWVAYDDVFYEQWVINNSHIANTRIIGNNPGDDYGSAILITPDGNTCISPEITGFTIQYGLGTLVERDGTQVRIGGGILADISDPLIKYNAFVNNGNPSLASGGAIQLTSSAEDWSFNDRFENVNPRCEVEEFRISDNLYDDNDALYGNSVANRFHEDSFDMSGSIFDVFNCGADPENSVSSVWVDVEDEAGVNYTDSEGNLCAFTAPDVYVDSNIDQECLEEGCGFINNPFKTITRTLEMILPTEDNPITIHLAPGTYSPETGESFPIIMMNYLNIEGDSAESSILDAMETNRVMIVEHCINNTISKLTITEGLVDSMGEENGGGMYIIGSLHLKLIEINILSNSAGSDWEGASGGGIHAEFSDISIFKCNFENNYSLGGGAGIYLMNSDCKIFRSIFNNNTHAIKIYGTTNLLVSKTLIYDNNAPSYGWSILDMQQHTSGQEDPTVFDGVKFNNVTIIDNISNNNGDIPSPFFLYQGNLKIENSILWDNTPSAINVYWTFDSIHIDYSDIDGGQESIQISYPEYFDGNIEWGENNIDNHPQFTNANYNLNLFTSPCVNTGNPDPWYNDTNSSRNDMGYTGGPNYEIDFTEYNFEQVGVNSTSVKNWDIINFGDEPIIIEEILNQNSNFSVVDTEFPIIVEPFTEKSIKLMFSPQSPGEHQATFNFISNQISEDATLILSGEGSSVIGNTLSGDLYGTILAEGSPYRIVNDINVNNNDVLIIESGVRFEFDGQYKFEVNGILEAIGTESDSIIFTTLFPDMPDSLRWLGIDMSNQTNATVLDYIRIEGATGAVFNGNCPTCYDATDGGALKLFNSDPLFNNMVINNATARYGGGIYMQGSNPIISNSIIKNSNATKGGGVYIYQGSHPTLQDVVIKNNDAAEGGGIWIAGGSINSNGGNVYVINNTSATSGNGGGIYGGGENIHLSNFYIIGNQAQRGGGIYIPFDNGYIISNSVIYDNSASMSEGSAISCTGYPASGVQTFLNNTVVLSNVVVMGNEATNAWTPEIPKSSIFIANGNIAFINSIFWDNEDPIILDNGDGTSTWSGLLLSTHSLIQGGTDNIFDELLNSESIADQIIWLDGNIDVNPQFNLGLEDFTLQENSPCVDAGIAYFEYADEVILDLDTDEYYGLAPDMGAVEFIPAGDCDVSSLGDINGDNIINILDIIQMINIILETSIPTLEEDCLADINEDGIINILDIVIIVNIILSP